jgi:hypothetical protein
MAARCFIPVIHKSFRSADTLKPVLRVNSLPILLTLQLLGRRSICSCWAASASFRDWTSAAVTVGGAGVAAAAASLAAGLPDPGVSAQAPAESAASVRAVSNTFLVRFMEVEILSFLSFGSNVLSGKQQKTLCSRGPRLSDLPFSAVSERYLTRPNRYY